MATADTDIRDELRSLFSFAHIHKWCTQLDERISAFVEETGKRDRKRVRSIVEEEYSDPLGPKEHLVLALLLASKLGEGSYTTTERLFAQLRGRLSLYDQNFLRTHLFGDHHPLPADVAYDIGSRPYLSFRRAISHGMKIQTVHSTFTPSEVALYLTMIMCRVDLNEQNRAMLSFLIYRIDARLPDNVLSGTLAYLRSLKAVIAELESKGDAALSGEFNYAEEPTIDGAVSPDGAERLAPLVEDGRVPVAPDTPSPEAPGTEPHERDAVGPSERGAEADRLRDSVDVSRGAEGRDRQEVASRPEPPQSTRFVSTPSVDDIVAGERLAGVPGLQTGGEHRPPSDDLDDRGPDGADERLGTASTQESGPLAAEGAAAKGAGRDTSDGEAATDYTIHFNRNLSELLRIIEDFDRPDADLPEIGLDGEIDVPSDETSAAPPRSDGQRRPSPRTGTSRKRAPKGEKKDDETVPVGAPAAESDPSEETGASEEERRDSPRTSTREGNRRTSEGGPNVDGPLDVEAAQSPPVARDTSPVTRPADGVESKDVDDTEGRTPPHDAAQSVAESSEDAADGRPAGPPPFEIVETPSDSAGRAKHAPPGDTTVESVEEGEEGDENGAPSRRRLHTSGRAIAAGGVALLFMLILAVRGNRRNGGDAPGGTPVDESVAIETGESSAPRGDNGESPVDGGGSLDSDRPERGPGEAAAVPAYRIEGGPDGFVWTVEAGETAWDLFQFASTTPIATADGAIYTVAQGVTWLQYVLDTFAANPQLEQFTIIFPGQRITLPDYR